jgi:hypothetical protein
MHRWWSTTSKACWYYVQNHASSPRPHDTGNAPTFDGVPQAWFESPKPSRRASSAQRPANLSRLNGLWRRPVQPIPATLSQGEIVIVD